MKAPTHTWLHLTSGSPAGSAANHDPANIAPNIRGRSCLRALMLSALIVTGASLMAFDLEGSGPAFKVEGNILYEVFLPDGEERHWSRDFTVVVQGCRWIIESYDIASGAYGMKLMTNGLIYSARRVPRPTRRDYTVIVEDDVVPYADTSGISVIWLAYASACYLASVENGRFKPVWHLDDLSLRTENYTVPGLLSRLNSGLPEELAYLNEGVIYGRAKGGRAIIRARSPLENLPTNAFYRVDGTTNVGGLTVPASFHFERYSLRPHDFAISRRLARISGALNSVSLTVDSSALSVELEGTMMVTDKRFERTDPQVGLLRYMTTNLQFLAADDARVVTEKQLALRSALLLEQDVSPAWRRFTLIILVVLALIPFMVWRRALRRFNQG